MPVWPRDRRDKVMSVPGDHLVRETPLRGIVNDWWERLYALVFGHTPIGDQVQRYSSGRTLGD